MIYDENKNFIYPPTIIKRIILKFITYKLLKNKLQISIKTTPQNRIILKIS